MIRENDGWDNWNMIKVCDYPCNNKREAELEEDRYMTELKSNMNSNRASRTHKQYYDDNKEKYKNIRKIIMSKIKIKYKNIGKNIMKQTKKKRKIIIKNCTLSIKKKY
jgi:hypothetical protein